MGGVGVLIGVGVCVCVRGGKGSVDMWGEEEEGWYV